MAHENMPDNKRDLPDMASQEDALNHVLEHTAKEMKAKSHLNFKGKPSKGAKRLGTATSHEVVPSEPQVEVNRDLTKLQPCSSLFRNFQSEFAKFKEDNMNEDQDRDSRLARYFNVDTHENVDQKQKDTLGLQKLIENKHDSAVEPQIFGFTQMSRKQPLLEQMAAEQITTYST